MDRWLEILTTLWRNRLRTGLTMLSVAWGIFVLVVLLGVGRGLENSVAWQFRDDAVNSIWMYNGRTSLPYQGQAVGRRVVFTDVDLDQVRALPEVERITGRFNPSGESVTWNGRASSFPIRSVHPDHRYLEQTLMSSGRWLNALDLDENRKVAVIGAEVVEQLFRNADPLGAWIAINGVRFRVVGTFDDVGGDEEMSYIYVPITTGRLAWGGARNVDQIMFTVDPASPPEEVEALTSKVQATLARRHRFDPGDERAVRVRNNVERFAQVQRVFDLLGAFVWLVGMGTVMAGVVGVSNIMLVSVAERTREFGLRKALGATPGAIVAMVMQEAVIVTSVAGYVGLVGGLALVEGLRRALPENDYVRDPDVDLGPALAAVVLLALSGALAGLFPSLRAARIHPVEALRSE